MLKQQICIDCGLSFMGGPRAWRCPVCRTERAKQTHKAHKLKKRVGLTRELGSKDTCKRCGNLYTVEGGLQQYCPDCQKEHSVEYDRKTSLEFYHQHKDENNPKRNQKRRKQGKIPLE